VRQRRYQLGREERIVDNSGARFSRRQIGLLVERQSTYCMNNNSIIYRTLEGDYIVLAISPCSYLVRRVTTGELIATCGSSDTARALADSRQWTDACDAAEERRALVRPR
jgi:hypothetical protein